MPDIESNEAFNILLKALEENELTWVAESVKAEIQLGKTVTKSVSRLPARTERYSAEILSEEKPKSRGKPTEFTTTEEYTPEEQFTILVDSLEHCLLDASDIANQVIIFASKSVAPDEPVIFAADEPESPSGFEITKDAPSRVEALTRIRDLISQIRVKS
jgi:hypothetical protein